jgi:hypothetical protein
MRDIKSVLADLNRPKLLVQAARIGLGSYDRKKMLTHLLTIGDRVGARQITLHLIEMEAELNEDRRSNNANYSVTRHIEILTALMAEAQTL